MKIRLMVTEVVKSGGGGVMALAEEGTVLRQYQEALAEAYEAISDGGSNDAEHEALINLIDIVEHEVHAMGGELPSRPTEWWEEEE
jgi:hemerythrin-like domain-containing protein